MLATGDRVVGTLRDLSAADDLKAQDGDRLWLAALDLTHIGEIRQTVDVAWVALGHIEVVVSNAGPGLRGAAEAVTDEQIRHQIEAKMNGSIQLVRSVLPHMREQGHGRILQVSGLGGQMTIPGSSLDPATKCGRGPAPGTTRPGLLDRLRGPGAP
ncbi:SDR family NAD(P)-dependent oxidoreductase [Streptomyces sp. KL109B]|uniref:SDR family NAD(P)-dependent oxidoreductase n=1 Tax=Streptomyces sp. KL109B TaxID=3045155 RepID=UPI00355917EE